MSVAVGLCVFATPLIQKIAKQPPEITTTETSNEEDMQTYTTTFCHMQGGTKLSQTVETVRQEDETPEAFSARHDASVAAAIAGKQLVDC